MNRFNMAQRKTAHEVFPVAAKTRTAIVAFTATRWGTLLEPYADWPGPPPTASDCVTGIVSLNHQYTSC